MLLPAFLLSAGIMLAQGSSACTDLQISGAASKNMTSADGLDHYTLGGTVTYTGSRTQPSNTLQRVDFMVNGRRKDVKGVPPLRPGQSYAFSFPFDRARSAGVDTTHIRFTIEELNGGSQTCSTSGSSAQFRV
jgi:hypothetical protein